MTIITYFLTQNRYSRNKTKMQKPEAIVLHDAMNEGYSAIAERNYLDNLKHGKNAIYYAVHYIIGLNGEIINCVPEDEIAYHRGNSANSDKCISIGFCTEKKGASMTQRAKSALKQLVRDIAQRHGLNINDCFLRHYDTAEKKCPVFYCKNESDWIKLKNEIIKEAEIYKQLEQNHDSICSGLEQLVGADKEHISAVLINNSSPDPLVVAGLICKALNIKL